MTNLIVTITGPSSSGKTVLSHLLRDNGLEPLVSTTTRPPRQREVNGKDYHFVTPEHFQDKLDRNEFIENVVYDDNHYGICVEEARRAFGLGKPAVLVAEPEGVRQIHAYAQAQGWDTLRIFVNNPPEVLTERMLDRFHEDTVHLEAGSPAYNAKRHTHGQRIVKVMGFEQENWVKPAMENPGAYDRVFHTFNDGNQASVLAEVLQRIREVSNGLAQGDGASPKRINRP
jgi:guanylate kinase